MLIAAAADDDDDDAAENTSFKVAPSKEGHPFDRSDQSLISFGICSGCGSVLRRSLSSAKSTKMHTRESAPLLLDLRPVEVYFDRDYLAVVRPLPE